jgi:hypothetical protein
MRMSRGTVLLGLAAALLAAGCGSDEGTGSTTSPTALSVVGTWKATRAEFVSATNSSLRVEVVAGGTSVMLVLESGGTYRQQVTDPGEQGETTTGTWSATKDVLTLTPTGMSWNMQFDMTVSASILTLNGGHVEFDVDRDGVDEEALAYLTLARQ